jgi:hypothetical protein
MRRETESKKTKDARLGGAVLSIPRSEAAVIRHWMPYDYSLRLILFPFLLTRDLVRTRQQEHHGDDFTRLDLVSRPHLGERVG